MRVPGVAVPRRPALPQREAGGGSDRVVALDAEPAGLQLEPCDQDATGCQMPREIHDDRQVIANGYLQEVDGGARGKFALVRSPVQFDGQRAELTRAPEMGEHTDEVLMEKLGLTIEELIEFKGSGAIL